MEEKLKTQIERAEQLSLKGNTSGEADLIVNDIIKVSQRFQARITEYKTLLTMSIKFYQDLQEVQFYHS